jgi:hypothetical protein
MNRIEYNGKVIETKHYAELSDEECAKIIEEMKIKPDIKEVEIAIKKFHSGDNSINKITRYLFLDLIRHCKVHHCKWTINDMFECNDLIRHFYAKTLSNKNVFNSDSIATNMETALRIYGKRVCQKVTNFQPKIVQMILDKYNINNHYYDFSCGWGVRLMTSMRNGVHYYGTDPNNELTPRLNKLKDMYGEVISNNSTVDIRCQSSEEFVSEWENKIGLVFTSPPYYALEDYKFGNQSIKDNLTYEEWLSNYMDKTIKNTKRYLIEDGVLAINIKNYTDEGERRTGKPFELYDDTKQICLDNGFILVDEISLDISKRKQEFNQDEKIMILKKNDRPIIAHNSIDDLFE